MGIIVKIRKDSIQEEDEYKSIHDETVRKTLEDAGVILDKGELVWYTDGEELVYMWRETKWT